MTSARAIRSINDVTSSKTTMKSLEVPGMCSGGSCDVEDRSVVSRGAGVVGGGIGEDESGTEVLSTSTSGTGCSPLGRSSAISSAASSYCCRRKESGIYKDRSMDKIRGQLSLRSMGCSYGNPRCSKTWHSNLGINRVIASARAGSLRWTFSSKCSNTVITSSEELNQNPSDIRYRAASIAPLRCT